MFEGRSFIRDSLNIADIEGARPAKPRERSKLYNAMDYTDVNVRKHQLILPKEGLWKDEERHVRNNGITGSKLKQPKMSKGASCKDLASLTAKVSEDKRNGSHRDMGDKMVLQSNRGEGKSNGRLAQGKQHDKKEAQQNAEKGVSEKAKQGTNRQTNSLPKKPPKSKSNVNSVIRKNLKDETISAKNPMGSREESKGKAAGKGSKKKDNAKYSYYEDVVNEFTVRKKSHNKTEGSINRELLETSKKGTYKTPQRPRNEEANLLFSSEKSDKEKVLDDFILSKVKTKYHGVIGSEEKDLTRNKHILLHHTQEYTKNEAASHTLRPKGILKNAFDAEDQYLIERSVPGKRWKSKASSGKKPFELSPKKQSRNLTLQSKESPPFATLAPKTIVYKMLPRLCGSNVVFTYYSSTPKGDFKF